MRCDRFQCLLGPQRDLDGVRVVDADVIWIDADQLTAALLHAPTELSHGGEGLARTDFDDQRALGTVQPPFEQHALFQASGVAPLPVIEHQDVGPQQRAAVRAAGQFTLQLACGFVHLRVQICGGPEDLVAVARALQAMNGAMAFIHTRRRKAGFLELPIDVAGEHEAALRHALAPATQQSESGMRRGGPVQVEAVTVEAPSGGGVLLKRARRRNVLEVSRCATNTGVLVVPLCSTANAS